MTSTHSPRNWTRGDCGRSATLPPARRACTRNTRTISAPRRHCVGSALPYEFDPQPTGRIAIAFEHRGVTSPSLVLDIRTNELDKVEAALTQAEPKHIRLALTVLVLLLAVVTGAMEARASDRMGFGGAALVTVILARLVAVYAARTIVSPVAYILVVVAILMPWLAVFASIRLRLVGRSDIAPRSAEPQSPQRGSSRRRQPLSIFELGVLALVLGLFAYMLWFGSSFRWSIFEERDFLEARLVAATGTFPLYGPELLLGGQTVGSSLYLLLAPVVALWNDPQALLLFNRLLFLGMGLVLWWGLRDWVGPGGAIFAVFALAASERIVALSYWPIHPNFSLFFGFLYACAILRGTVDAHRGWLILSGLLLGVLTQLHFSYFLLLPCHFLLVAFGNEGRDRWTKPLAAAAVFIPLAPFLIIDAVQGFPNISQIVQRPRLHADYPNVPFGNIRLLSVALAWPQQISGPYSSVSSNLTMLLIGIGLAVGLGSAAARMNSERGRMTPAFAATLLLCVPLFELTAQGLGYNSRHTLSTAPPLFLLAAFGVAAVINSIGATRPWIGMALILPLIGALGLRAANSTTLARVIQSEGEWAVDYRSREAIATDLATRLGLSPGMYPNRTIWWWVGWSIDPAIYRDYYESVVRVPAPGSVLAADEYVLVTGAAELPPYLASAFDDKEVRPVAGMYVHVATPNQKTAAVFPSSNADTGVRLPSLSQGRRPRPGPRRRVSPHRPTTVWREETRSVPGHHRGRAHQAGGDNGAKPSDGSRPFAVVPGFAVAQRPLPGIQDGLAAAPRSDAGVRNQDNG